MPPTAMAEERESQRTSPDLGSSRTKHPALDGLRCWVILVVLAHFGNFSDPPTWHSLQRLVLLAAQMAFVGMDVFFVLSGFLITRILLDTRADDTYFRTFYSRRVLRIFPVYYGFLALYFLVLPQVVTWDRSDVTVTPLQHFFYWSYLQNYWAGLGAAPAPTSFLNATNHVWSLAVEEQFYFLWPLVVRFSSQHVLKRICLACLLLAPLVRIALVVTLEGSINAGYMLTPARVDGLALGALLAIVAREPQGLGAFVQLAKRTAPISLLVLLVLFFPADDLNPSFITVGMTASVYLAGAIVLLTLTARPGGLIEKTLSASPLRAIGRYSYAIYVVHFPLGYVLNRSGIVTRAAFHAQIPDRFFAELAYSGTVILACVLAGALSWHLLERPILGLRRHLPYGRVGSPSTSRREPETAVARGATT